MDQLNGNPTPNVNPQPPQPDNPNQSVPYAAPGAPGQQFNPGQGPGRPQPVPPHNGPYQQYNYPPHRPSLFRRLYGKTDTPLDILLTVVSVILFILVPLALIYPFFLYIALEIEGAYGTTATTFISYIKSGVFYAAIYMFFSCMLIVAKKLVNKK